LPFDNFRSKPAFESIEEYLAYKNGVMEFIKARNRRIERWVEEKNASR